MFLRRLSLFKQSVKYLSTATIITSKAKQLQIPKITLQECVWNNLDKWPDKTAIICFETHRKYTYHQLYTRSLSITRFLKNSLKFKKHETVAVVLQNIPEYPIVLLGAVQAGLRVTPCNPTYTPDEIKRQLVDSKSKLVFTSSDLLPVVRQATNLPIVEISNNRNVTNGAISFEEISTGETCQPVNDVTVDDIIILPYSSGTTGLPKGVQLNHYNMVSNLCQITAPEFILLQNKNESEVIPAVLPFFHIYGLVQILLQILTVGATLLTVPKFTSDNFIKLLKNYKTDVLFGVPLMVIMANNNPNIKGEDLAKIRTFVSGAAPLGGSDVEKFHDKTNHNVRIVQSYGMTETSPVTVMQSVALENGIKIGGSGFLLPNTQGKIIPVDGSHSENLRPGESGELVIKGPQVMPGYYNNDQANKDIFLEEGWIKTGDIAHYDEDHHFFITDRCKELIKVKGFQVAPAEIEAILRCHPRVDDVAVVGVRHSVLGEAPKAFIVTKPGQSVQSAELEMFVAEKVARHKHLVGGVVFLDAIPKSASGKILRRELKKL